MLVDESQELLYENDSLFVYFIPENEHGLPVVVKVLKTDSSSSLLIKFLKNEYELTRDLPISGVRKSLTLTKIDNKPALVMEYVPGQTLKQVLAERKLSIIESLTIAVRVAQILGELHEKHIIHGNINCNNILVEQKTMRVTLIDFSLSSRFDLQIEFLGNPECLPGDLAYISPEQTGRMNRMVDYRTDLYSLGIVIYEMLTGTLPFEAGDALALVHAHIAKTPKSLKDINPDIPALISGIVLKLLAKNAEDRYQSAFGLQTDLERCLAYLQGPEGISNPAGLSFELGRNDSSTTFHIPQKLYGRSAEISELLAAFERAASGSMEAMVVTGNPGVGKSVLVAEVYKPITEKRGYFISGKFDQYQRNIPYAAFIQAFNQFCNLLLCEPEALLNDLRDKITNAVGVNGAFLTELMPDIENLIGKQQPIRILAGPERHKIFNVTFQKFMHAVCTTEHPLVIFIDDCQRADSASLDLLKIIFSNEDNTHLLVIMSYRDTEVSLTHPLMLALADMEKTGVKPHRIVLSLLKETDINRMIADTLNCDLKSALPLTKLVYKITKGNPFFNNQFLKVLHGEGMITFDVKARSWTYDVARVNTLKLPDDVVLFIAMQLQKLKKTTQDILQLASCIGSLFDLETLALVYQKPETVTAAALKDAVQEGVIIYLEEINNVPTYRFIHDRVQQAAYSLIPDAQKQLTHLNIGRLMLKNTAETELYNKIFEILNHLNRCLDLQDDLDSRIELSRLNFIAGQRAKSAAAFSSAWNYFKIGLDLLPENCWQRWYQFTRDLYEASVEAAYFIGDFGAMQRLTDIVLKEVRPILDRIRVYEVNIQALVAQNKLLESVNFGLQVLKLFGVIFPEKPGLPDIMAALQEIQSVYREKNVADLANLPMMIDPVTLGAMRILISVSAAAYLSSPEFYTLLILKQVNLSAEYGNTPFSCFSYASVGLLLCGVAGEIEVGYQFGQLALDLLHRLNVKELYCKIYHIVNAFINHWKGPVQDTLIQLRSAYYSGLETGDFEFAGYAVILSCNLAYAAGIEKELSELREEAFAFGKSIYQLKQMTVFQWFQMLQQAIHNTREGRTSSTGLQGEYYDEKAMHSVYLHANNRLALFTLHFHKLLLSYLFGDYAKAVEDANQVEQYMDGVVGFAYVPIVHLFDSLARIALYRKDRSGDKDRLLVRIEANQKKMKTWASYAPMNCQYKYDLVEAVRNQLFGEKLKAIDYFDRAIKGAAENGYIRDEAIANELAAGFYLDWGKENAAAGYMQKAYEGYVRWGAAAKALQLKRDYTRLLAPALVPQIGPAGEGGAGGSVEALVSTPLDLFTVVKASHAITGEIDLGRLLRQMMSIVLENAGAQRGALLLEHGGEWAIEALADVDSEIIVLQSLPLRDSTAVPVGIIDEVARSCASVVLDDAAEAGNFIHDPYIARNRVKSVICMPLINQGRLSGILYLENDLATHAFSEKRLELLNLLSTQMALSLDNARLYQRAQQEIAGKKLAEAASRESEHRFQVLVETLSDWVWEVGENSVYTYVNSRVRDILGYEPDEMIGRSAYDFIPPEESERIYRLFWQHLTEGRKLIVFEYIARRKDGRLLEFETTAAPIYNDAGKLIGFHGIDRDITERKRAEKEILRLNEELELRVIERTAQLEAANKELEAFSYSVSHDLRAPLRAIDGYTRMLVDDYLDRFDDEGKRVCGVISSETRRMSELIDDLLSFSRLSRVEINMSSIDMNALVDSVFEELSPPEKRGNLEIRVDDLPAAKGDRSLLRQVWINLISNSIKFTSKKDRPVIEINGKIDNGRIVYSIRDNGAGFNMRYYDKLFGVFQRLHSIKDFDGTGVGLAIVQRIIRRHGGEIRAEAEPDKGATFYLTLPGR